MPRDQSFLIVVKKLSYSVDGTKLNEVDFRIDAEIMLEN